MKQQNFNDLKTSLTEKEKLMNFFTEEHYKFMIKLTLKLAIFFTLVGIITKTKGL